MNRLFTWLVVGAMVLGVLVGWLINVNLPADEAKAVADQLRSNGRVIRGRIGVQIAAVTKDVAESIGLGKPIGALVRSVEPGGPAEKAGIEAGDIITKVDGRVVEKSSDLPRVVGNSRPGSRVAVQVFRRGAYRDLNVTVAEFEADAPRRQAQAEPEGAGTPVKTLGLSLVDLTEAQKRELKVKGGVRVEAVEGPAARAGLREGDVILSVDNTEVTDLRQFQALVQKADKSKPLSVLVRRGEWVNYFVIRPNR